MDRSASLDHSAVRLPGLSIFLPAHNEEANIERVARALADQASRLAADYEVIIVDDGSTDRTGEISDHLAATDPHFRVVHHPRNRGYGAAVTTGLRAARLPFVLLCDGDGQFDPADLIRLVSRADQFDIVAGRRSARVEGPIRRFNGWAWTTLVRLLFKVQLSDIDCGFKLFNRKSIQDLPLKAQGAMISTELIVRAAARGARIGEVDVTHLPRLSGTPTGANLKVIARAFRELFKLYRELRSDCYRSYSERNAKIANR